MKRERAVNIAVGCVMASAMDALTKFQVIEELRGIEKELDEKLEDDWDNWDWGEIGWTPW